MIYPHQPKADKVAALGGTKPVVLLIVQILVAPVEGPPTNDRLLIGGEISLRR